MSTAEALEINCCNEACTTDDTAIGKAGELDRSLYQLVTKSLMIMVTMSFRATETSGESGARGAKVWGVFCDHCDRVSTACQAAGVENASGGAARRRGL